MENTRATFLCVINQNKLAGKAVTITQQESHHKTEVDQHHHDHDPRKRVNEEMKGGNRPGSKKNQPDKSENTWKNMLISCVLNIDRGLISSRAKFHRTLATNKNWYCTDTASSSTK